MRRKAAFVRRARARSGNISSLDSSLFGNFAWIRPLATPYLRGYRAAPARRGSLRGYWFFQAQPPVRGKAEKISFVAGGASGKIPAVGFFVGYLVDAAGYAFLSPEIPECLVFAWVHPRNGRLSRRLASRSGFLRQTFEYIRWLTHRPPRFVFHERESAMMVRHQTMKGWAAEQYEHYSKNFFIETLAWLVRSGVVRKLGAEAFPGQPAR